MTAQELLEKLSLEEKITLLQGGSAWTTTEIPRILFKSIFLADGPMACASRWVLPTIWA